MARDLVLILKKKQVHESVFSVSADNNYGPIPRNQPHEEQEEEEEEWGKEQYPRGQTRRSDKHEHVHMGNARG
ncbi:unnamed protein product [Fusarium graminearum]|uniref:Chromosome 1, complete genome n=1 Tax=Gibberella zeae (strain ATCC MYA-4620 / CBS 123657 / FGSC 9075 / NRRL 31084 / PH-1) TaxID=229533 RepID=A0A0E0RS11_GIBZE|nr:hypothetical protein FG05_30011 [Fusarium graminearum]CAF3630435.1 unnamed protein product [Fusarium graminearum]CEF74036.1 unnamed protein product [Fusarium graminearum]